MRVLGLTAVMLLLLEVGCDRTSIRSDVEGQYSKFRDLIIKSDLSDAYAMADAAFKGRVAQGAYPIYFEILKEPSMKFTSTSEIRFNLTHSNAWVMPNADRPTEPGYRWEMGFGLENGVWRVASAPHPVVD